MCGDTDPEVVIQMHNCKSARSNFVELAVNELEPAAAQRLLAEVNDCVACRTEYAALTSTLHVSTQALRSSLPSEKFWSGYSERLHERLLAETQTLHEQQPQHSSISVWEQVRSLAASSVRVPVPVALGLVLLVGISFFAVRSRGETLIRANTQSPSVITRTVEVPVVQEKVVTRVVYLEKPARQSRRAGTLESNATIPGAVARAETQAAPPLNLVDFKPTDQVKLTVIKGAYKDQK